MYSNDTDVMSVKSQLQKSRLHTLQMFRLGCGGKLQASNS